MALIAASATPGAMAQLAVPPVARVTDQTGTLSAPQRAALEQRLAAFEQRKGSQMAVLIVGSTQPETIEQYAIRVAEAWKLGRKGVDDGILILVAKDDRALRIEVGYGLEGAVPDAIAKRVIAEIITPYFRDGDFYGGLSAGIDQLVHVVDGEPLPEPRRPSSAGGDGLQGLMTLGFFGLMFSQLIGRAIGEVPSSLTVSSVFGLIAWLMLGTLAGAAVAAVILFVMSLIFQLGRGGGSGWRGGGLPGGFRGGGGFGGGLGGGFRGGGGGFGGGGASGRW